MFSRTATSAPTSKTRYTSITTTSAPYYSATSRRRITFADLEPLFFGYLIPGTTGVLTFKYRVADRVIFLVTLQNVQNLKPSRSCLPWTYWVGVVLLVSPPKRRSEPGPDGVIPLE
ncbi:hypothetical protein P9112_005682 [Eukaryota sp. TZLM1-RC]